MLALVVAFLGALEGSSEEPPMRVSAAPTFVLRPGMIEAELGGLLRSPLYYPRGHLAVGIPARFELGLGWESFVGPTAHVWWAPFEHDQLSFDLTVGAAGLVVAPEYTFGTAHSFLGPTVGLSRTIASRVLVAADVRLVIRLDGADPASDFMSSRWVASGRALGAFRLGDALVVGATVEMVQGSPVTVPTTVGQDHYDTGMAWQAYCAMAQFQARWFRLGVSVGAIARQFPEESGHLGSTMYPIATVEVAGVFDFGG